MFIIKRVRNPSGTSPTPSWKKMASRLVLLGYTAYLHLMTRSRSSLSRDSIMTIITDLINLPRPSRIRGLKHVMKWSICSIISTSYVIRLTSPWRWFMKAYRRVSPALAIQMLDVRWIKIFKPQARWKDWIFWLPGMPTSERQNQSKSATP